MEIDYGTLNAITEDYWFSLPNIDEFLMELGQGNFISRFDAMLVIIKFLWKKVPKR